MAFFLMNISKISMQPTTCQIAEETEMMKWRKLNGLKHISNISGDLLFNFHYKLYSTVSTVSTHTICDKF